MSLRRRSPIIEMSSDTYPPDSFPFGERGILGTPSAPMMEEGGRGKEGKNGMACFLAAGKRPKEAEKKKGRTRSAAGIERTRQPNGCVRGATMQSGREPMWDQNHLQEAPRHSTFRVER